MQNREENIIDIAKQNDLGSVENTKILTGGRLHKVHYLKTDKGEFVLKILNPRKINSTEACDKYTQFEFIASSFNNKGIKTVPALHAGPKLTEAGNYLLIYPYQKGQVIDGSSMNVKRATRIGALLGSMHKATLSEIKEEVRPHAYQININKWEQTLVENETGALKAQMNDSLDKLKEVHQKAMKACSEHKPFKEIISHGDMDLGNVIWDDNDDPWLIDWEYAGKFDALYDLINSALYSSEISPGNFSMDIFKAVMQGYARQSAFPANCSNESVSEAVHLALAGWMRWVNFNFDRLENSQNPEEKALGIGQIEKWSKTILGVYENHSNILDIVANTKLKQENKYMHTGGFWANNAHHGQDIGLVCTIETSPDMHFG